MARKLTCAEADALLDETGRYDGWTAVAGRTDMTGEYGDPRIETIWEKNGRRIRTVRHPNPDGGPDVRPCEHYDLGSEEEHDG